MTDDLFHLKPQTREILRLLRERPSIGLTGREIDTLLAQETGHGCVDYRKRISELRQSGIQVLTVRERSTRAGRIADTSWAAPGRTSGERKNTWDRGWRYDQAQDGR